MIIGLMEYWNDGIMGSVRVWSEYPNPNSHTHFSIPIFQYSSIP